MENCYLTPAQIADMTNMKIGTVWGWIRSERLKAYCPNGKTYLVKREDFEAFIENTNRPTKRNKGCDVQ